MHVSRVQDNGRIQMTCSDVRTQSCDGGYYDYILVSPDWTWEKYYLWVSRVCHVPRDT